LAVGMGFPAVFLAYKLLMACWFCTAGRAKFAREDRAHEEKMLLEREEMERAALAAQAQAQADQQLLLIQQQQQQQQARGSVSAPMNMSSRSSKFWIDEELQAWRLDFQQLKLTKCLTVNTPKQNRHVPGTTTTTGPALGEVWLATYFAMDEENHQRQVALKWISPKLVNTEVQQEKLKEEIKRQAKLRHPNVAAFIGIAWSPETNLVAVTEYMPRGDLRQWLHRTAAKDAGRWTPAKVKMLLDIANALVYLHSFQPRLIHGNVNSRNVLLNDRMEAKLSDFGAPKDYLSEREINAYKEVGSGRWISPEALIGREGADHVNDATDVYSLGILMVEMDSHQLPFADLMPDRSALPELDVLQLISNGALTPSLSVSCLPRIQSLVQACTAYDPQKRPSSRSIAKTLQAVLAEVSGKQQHGG
jgi:serine/threonine protein kinase